jgi:hypothetical protein
MRVQARFDEVASRVPETRIRALALPRNASAEVFYTFNLVHVYVLVHVLFLVRNK